jgi:hypothetical protein
MISSAFMLEKESVIIHGAPSNFPNKRKNIREGFVV